MEHKYHWLWRAIETDMSIRSKPNKLIPVYSCNVKIWKRNVFLLELQRSDTPSAYSLIRPQQSALYNTNIQLFPRLFTPFVIYEVEA